MNFFSKWDEIKSTLVAKWAEEGPGFKYRLGYRQITDLGFEARSYFCPNK